MSDVRKASEKTLLPIQVSSRRHFGANAQGDAFAYDVVVADAQLSGFASELEITVPRRCAQMDELYCPCRVVSPSTDDVRKQLCISARFYAWPDNAVGTDLSCFIDLGARARQAVGCTEFIKSFC
ncbi:MAG: hypothetical protein R3C68_07860 [Myxococcota bacterium]